MTYDEIPAAEHGGACLEDVTLQASVPTLFDLIEAEAS